MVIRIEEKKEICFLGSLEICSLIIMSIARQIFVKEMQMMMR